MSGQGLTQILVYAVVLVALGYPLGIYMARVYADGRVAAGRWFGWLGWIENGFYRLIRADWKKEQDWKSYSMSVLVFTIPFLAILYVIQRVQGHLFLNPDHMKGVPAQLWLA